MEPETADEYDRLMKELQDAAEKDPLGDRAKDLRSRIEAILREHMGSAAEPVPPESPTTH